MSEKNLNIITGETCKLLINMKVGFNYVDEEILRIGNVTDTVKVGICSLGLVILQKNIKKLEIIERVVVDILTSLKQLPHDKRLHKLKLPT